MMSNQTKPNQTKLWCVNLGLCATVFLPDMAFSAAAAPIIDAQRPSAGQQDRVILAPDGKTTITFSAFSNAPAFLYWLGDVSLDSRARIDYKDGMVPAIRLMRKYLLSNEPVIMKDIYDNPDTVGFVVCLAARHRKEAASEQRVNLTSASEIDKAAACRYYGTTENEDVRFLFHITEITQGSDLMQQPLYHERVFTPNGFLGCDTMNKPLCIKFSELDAMWEKIAAQAWTTTPLPNTTATVRPH